MKLNTRHCGVFYTNTKNTPMFSLNLNFPKIFITTILTLCGVMWCSVRRYGVVWCHGSYDRWCGVVDCMVCVCALEGQNVLVYLRKFTLYFCY